MKTLALALLAVIAFTSCDGFFLQEETNLLPREPEKTTILLQTAVPDLPDYMETKRIRYSIQSLPGESKVIDLSGDLFPENGDTDAKKELELWKDIQVQYRFQVWDNALSGTEESACWFLAEGTCFSQDLIDLELSDYRKSDLHKAYDALNISFQGAREPNGDHAYLDFLIENDSDFVISYVAWYYSDANGQPRFQNHSPLDGIPAHTDSMAEDYYLIGGGTVLGICELSLRPN